MSDAPGINTSEDYEVRYCTNKFGVSQDRLTGAAQKIGKAVSAVEKELKAA